MCIRDRLMSIDAHWYSTMYSWYTFASTFVSGLSLMAIYVVYLKNQGKLEYVTDEHLHDLGKFMFAFSIFWAYLWFSQYMLIWYSNQPEETRYFVDRIGTVSYTHLDVYKRQDMNAGAVGALLVYDCNPCYNYIDAKKFTELLAKVPVTVSFSSSLDETTEQCKYVLPAHHWLESWGDAEPKSGYVSMIQPVINPLFKTRPFQESLLKWIGNITPYDAYYRNYWTARLGSTTVSYTHLDVYKRQP